MASNLVDFLTRRGIAILRLYDRGIGQSAGDSATVTTADRVRDPQATLRFLRTQPLLDIAHVSLIGQPRPIIAPAALEAMQTWIKSPRQAVAPASASRYSNTRYTWSVNSALILYPADTDILPGC